MRISDDFELYPAWSRNKELILDARLGFYPPSVNEMYRFTKYNHMYKTKKASETQDRICQIFEVEKTPSEEGKNVGWKGAVSVEVVFYLPWRRRFDVDNHLKALLDCLMAAKVIEDDSQTVRLAAEKRKGDTETRIKVWSKERGGKSSGKPQKNDNGDELW